MLKSLGAWSIAVACAMLPRVAASQDLTGAIIGTVKDAGGGVLPGALVRVTSSSVLGGPITVTTNERGQMRFAALPPGSYDLDVELAGFAPYHEADIRIGAGATLERTPVLSLSGLAESIVVEGAGSRIDARNPGVATRFGPDDLSAIPTRRSSMFDAIRATPGVSPTSPSSGTNTTISAFGSGTNENQFLFDGTNFTCPCNGVARAEPGVDFIQEVQLQTLGASAEFGNAQGAVINIVTRQGSDRLLFDASYHAQTSNLTSRPVVLPMAAGGESGYNRAQYRDMTTNVGGPAIPGKLWFFGGYQYLRDYDSQPGADPTKPRTYEQDKIFAKLTWRIAPAWLLDSSMHDEFWVNPDAPTIVTPFEAIARPTGTVPAITFGHLTHTVSSNTLWDVRVGRFVYSRDEAPSTGDPTIPSRFNRLTGVTSGAPPQLAFLQIMRTTTKATLSHYQPHTLGADHQWKIGGQAERGEHDVPSLILTGARYVDDGANPFQQVSRAPSHEGGVALTFSAFASDTVSIGQRLTINAGVRFDHSRAISPDLHALDAQARETDEIVAGLGTLYTWNIVSPRLGMTTKLSADGRTILRASYGRFSQGVLTGEIGMFHPAVTAIRTTAFVAATGGYTQPVSVVDPRFNLRSIPIRARRAPTNCRSGSIAKSGEGWRLPSRTFARTARTSSAGPMWRASIGSKRACCRMAKPCPSMRSISR